MMDTCVWTLCLLLVIVAGVAAAAEAPGLVMVTHGPPAVTVPATSTDNQPVRYGIGFPMQVGPTTAALLCNLRTIGEGRGDHEDGTDAFLFDDVRAVAQGGPVVLSRNERERDDGAGRPRIIIKFPLTGGFWPLGAKRADGSAHPGAGRGFAFCQALSFEDQGGGLFTWAEVFRPYVEVVHLAFDGRTLEVARRELRRDAGLWQTDDHWAITAPGLLMAIPDGDDLLLALTAARDGVSSSGVCRFRFAGGEWHPATFTPVDPGSEPSLVRAADGTLVFGVRGYGGEANSLQAWHSTDGGRLWEHTLQFPDMRTEAPVSLHATADGTVFIATNVLGTVRNRLVMWELRESFTQLGPPRLVRDGLEEFGPAPAKTTWGIDHPSSATVRLGDGDWHSVMAYRLLSYRSSGAIPEPLTLQTGCYLEEMLSAGPPLAPWRFD